MSKWIGDKLHPTCSGCNTNIIDYFMGEYAECDILTPMPFCPKCGSKMDVEEKHCEDCKCFDIDPLEEPCSSCKDHSNWESEVKDGRNR